jgi:hypothetical protein
VCALAFALVRLRRLLAMSAGAAAQQSSCSAELAWLVCLVYGPQSFSVRLVYLQRHKSGCHCSRTGGHCSLGVTEGDRPNSPLVQTKQPVSLNWHEPDFFALTASAGHWASKPCKVRRGSCVDAGSRLESSRSCASYLAALTWAPQTSPITRDCWNLAILTWVTSIRPQREARRRACTCIADRVCFARSWPEVSCPS